jgi:hypothetical protein
MTDPTRLIDEAGGDELEGSLLNMARNEGPSPEARRKILAGIAAASVATSATQTASAAAKTGKSLGLAKWGALAVAAAVIPAALWWQSGESAPSKSVAPAPLAPAMEVQPRPAQPQPAEVTPAPVALDDLPTLPPRASAAGSAPVAKQGSLADEVAQLQKAKLALKGGNATRALAELNTYSQRFPRPMLGAEATVVRIEALSATGDGARAKALAEGFLAKNPNSPYAARLRKLTGAQ